MLTLGGDPDALVADVTRLGAAAIELIDLRHHVGVHPRLGALDVVPFAPPRRGPLHGAVLARDAAVDRLADLGLPCFRYGPLTDGADRSLPEVRRRAFRDLAPDAGPPAPHPTAGAVCVGARQPLLAWNVWLARTTRPQAAAIARSLRGPAVRALGLEVTGAVQVSCNLLDPSAVTPLEVLDRIESLLPRDGAVLRCEVVGLVPDEALEAVPEAAWARLGLEASRSLEAALAARSPG